MSPSFLLWAVSTTFFLYSLFEGQSEALRGVAAFSCSNPHHGGPINRQSLTVLAAKDKGTDGTENNKKRTNNNGFLKRSLEGAVRQISGETDYELGDLGDKPRVPYRYQFGDITRSILAEVDPNRTTATAATAATGQNMEEPQGNLLQEWRSSLQEKDLPIELLDQFFSRLDQKQRIFLILTGCQLCAEGIVLWGLFQNICTIITASLSWGATLLSTAQPLPLPLLPIHMDPELWRTFTSKYTGFHLILSPLFLVVKAIGTLVGFRKFHSIVHQFSRSQWIIARPWQQQQQQQRYHSITLQKAIAIVVTFFITNYFLSAIAAGLAFSSISLGCRIWFGLLG